MSGSSNMVHSTLLTPLMYGTLHSTYTPMMKQQQCHILLLPLLPYP